MAELEKPSLLEKVSGNLVTEAALTSIGALAAFPLAPLLPVLSNSLANRRHKERVEKVLTEIKETLSKHETTLRDLSDSQFKIINEAILTILQTTEDAKIEYLKDVIRSNLENERVPISFASQVSRILRDISAEELRFLIENSRYSTIVFDLETVGENELKVEANSEQGAIVTGLISMGVIIWASSGWDSVGRYKFSPLVSKVLSAIGT